MIQETLKKLGCQVALVTDGEEAFRKFESKWTHGGKDNRLRKHLQMTNRNCLKNSDNDCQMYENG